MPVDYMGCSCKPEHGTFCHCLSGERESGLCLSGLHSGFGRSPQSRMLHLGFYSPFPEVKIIKIIKILNPRGCVCETDSFYTLVN